MPRLELSSKKKDLWGMSIVEMTNILVFYNDIPWRIVGKVMQLHPRLTYFPSPALCKKVNVIKVIKK